MNRQTFLLILPIVGLTGISCAPSEKANRSLPPLTSQAATIRYDGNPIKTDEERPLKIDVSLKAIEIKPDREWTNLKILDDQARAFLAKKFPRFMESTNLFLNVRITPGNRREYYSLYYYGTRGVDPYWVATFDSSGNISGGKTGVVTEEN